MERLMRKEIEFETKSSRSGGGKTATEREGEMKIIITVKDTDNIVGLKEDIAMRLEGVADIVRIDVEKGKECTI